ncbi:MAG TPA: glycosyltransferase family 2 protein [Polyangia bacterium]|jgi:glycosyltransferase involved in cell wall biosynthesis
MASVAPAGPYCSVVVPCYRSAKTVGPLCDRLEQVLGGLGRGYEIVFVNDDSPDDVGAVLDELQRRAPDRVGVVHLMRNAGQHAAIMAGLQRVRGEVVITLDDDLQNPPEEIPKLLAALGPKVDVVIGVPEREPHPAWSALAGRLTEATIGKPRHLRLSSYRALRRQVVDALLQSRSPFLFLEAEIFRVTTRIVNVTVEHHPPADGRSGYTVRSLGRLTTHLVFNHSSLPLRLISVVGITAAIGALLLALWIVVRHLLGIQQQLGWPSLAVLSSFLGGATLFSLGMIGEYLIRIIHQTAQRPLSHVRREELPRAAGAAARGGR